jgi:hypothetical protein
MGISCRGELVQSTLYTCIELPQWNHQMLLIFTDSKHNKSIQKIKLSNIHNKCNEKTGRPIPRKQPC